MPIVIRTAVKAFVVLAVASAVVLAVVWPWPAPEIDWRTPVNAALGQNDCRRAAAILYAASTAGSIEAFRKRAELARRDVCADEWEGVLDRSEALQFFRKVGANATIDWLYQVDEEGLGAWRAAYVRAAIVLCVVPYDSKYRTDFVTMSADFPDDGGWIMAVHRQRRNVCAAVLEHLAAQLVDDGDNPANKVAEALLMGGPQRDSPRTDFLSAMLQLEQQLTPVFDDERDDELVRIRQDIALSKLRNAAGAGHSEAVRLLASLLHQGRFGSPDDKEAYFWVLRARRLGHPESPIASEIEQALTDADRKSTATEEETDWQTKKALSLPE